MNPKFRLSAIRLLDVRGFKGEHILKLSNRLNTVVGVNNIGKSTILRSPVSILAQIRDKFNNEKHGKPFVRIGESSAEMVLRFTCLGLDKDDIRKDFAFGVMRGSISNAYNRFGFTLSEDSEVLQLIEDECHEVEVGLRVFTGRAPQRIFRVLFPDRPGRRFAWFQTSPERQFKCVDSSWTLEISHDQASARIEQMLIKHLQQDPAPITSWAHAPFATSEEWTQGRRRVLDDTEDHVKQALLFLKVKHDEEFKKLRNSVLKAFSEFSDLLFNELSGPYEYRPSFQFAHSVQQIGSSITREVLGSGCWTFLSILTAARTALVTGAGTLILDEPHLYLHPGLERRLLRELTEPELWDGNPLQIVAATHSPVFVDAACRQGELCLLNWTDDRRDSVKMFDVSGAIRSRDEKIANFWKARTSLPSELLYADRVVFVEGPSDKAALELIIGVVKSASAQATRIETLCRTDKIVQKDMIHVLSILAQAATTGFIAKPALILDSDKRSLAEKEWEKLKVAERPPITMSVTYAGHPNNDLESWFCEQQFLEYYFASCEKAVLDDKSRASKISETLLRFKEIWKTKTVLSSREKGCVVIDELHDSCLGQDNIERGKENYLQKMMDFLIRNLTASQCEAVKSSLKPIFDVLELQTSS